MADQDNLSGDPEIAKQIVNAQLSAQSKRIDIGAVGRLFGSSGEKPGNIAGIVVIISFILILTLIFLNKSYFDDLGKKDIIALLVNLIVLSLGYLFGRSSSS